MVATQRGDQHAYACLLGELERSVRAYLIHRFGYSEAIDDYVQESLLAVHHARHTYAAGRPLKPWLYAIVRNRTIDCMRRARHQPIAVSDTVVEIEAALYPDQAIDAGKLLARLSDSLRRPLYLTKFVGLTNRECAARLGISETAVKVRVYRALRKLRADWHGVEYD